MRGVETKRDTDVDHVDDLEQQVQHEVVVDMLAELRLQNIVRDAVKEVVDVHFQNILHILRVGLDPFLYDFLCLVGSALG